MPQAAAGRELADLRDDDATAVARGHGHRQHLALDRLALHRDVAVLVGGRAPDDGHVDRERVVQQPLAAAQRDDLDEVLGRGRVLLATGLARVDVRAQAHLRHESRPAAPRSRASAATARPAGTSRTRSRSASTSAPRRGSFPMLLPIVRRMRPGRPSCENPRSAKSPMPTTRTVVRSRGPALGGVDRGQLVDEALRQRVAGARTADHDRAAVPDAADRVPDVEDLGHGM